MSHQNLGHIRQEGLEALEAEVVAGFPADLQRRPEPRYIPRGPGDSLAGRQPTPPLQHLDGGLAPVPGGPAERVQQLPPVNRARSLYLDCNSSASSYRFRMRMGPAPSRPLSDFRLSVSLLGEGTIARGGRVSVRQCEPLPSGGRSDMFSP